MHYSNFKKSGGDMNPKIIGEFIAALRKSKGFTQQEVAEKLHISNKTVSKWERGDGYPEISLIPAIAELFEVSIDEIFQGKRLPKNEIDSRKNVIQVEKQVENLINRSLIKFKNNSFLSLAIIFVGFILLFAIAYSFYRPVLAVSVTSVLVVVAIIFEFIAANNTIGSLKTTSIFRENDARISIVYSTLYKYGVVVIASAITVLVLTVPFIIIRDPHLSYSVIQLSSYLKLVPSCLLASILICFIVGKIARPLFRIEHSKELKRSARKFATLLTVLLGLTLIGHLYILNQLGYEEQIHFESVAELERFATDYQEYQVKRRTHNLLMDHQFENITGWSYKDLVAYRYVGLAGTELNAARIETSLVFSLVYLLEVVMIIILYYRKKHRKTPEIKDG